MLNPEDIRLIETLGKTDFAEVMKLIQQQG